MMIMIQIKLYPFHLRYKSYYKLEYYNLGEGNPVKYLAQTQSQAKSSRIKIPAVHGIGKGLDKKYSQKSKL